MFGKSIENTISKVGVKIEATRKQYLNGHLGKHLKENYNFVFR